MAVTTYNYSISQDFPNQKVDASRLTKEIDDSAITETLRGVGVNGDDCSVIFDDALSAGDKTILDDLVAVHTGEPMPDTTCNRTTRDPTVNDDETWGFGVGSCWFNMTDLNTWTCLDASGGAAVWRIAAENVERADEEEVSSTNSTTLQDKAVWSGHQPTGNYRIEFSCEMTTSLKAKKKVKNVTIEPGVRVIFEVNGEEANSLESLSTKFQPVTAYVDVDMTAGTQEVKIRYASLYGDAVSIRRARIEIRRNS